MDLSFSAHSNARLHYDARKKHVAKQAKTLAANEAALKAAEKKAAQQLLQVWKVWEADGVHCMNFIRRQRSRQPGIKRHVSCKSDQTWYIDIGNEGNAVHRLRPPPCMTHVGAEPAFDCSSPQAVLV